MPTHQAKAGEIIMIDPAEGWNIDAPVTPVNNDRFSVVTLTEDLTPVKINGSFIGGVSGFRLVWPNATIEFCYAADGPYWFALNLVDPVTARTAADGSGWNPGSLGGGWDTAELTFDANITKYIAYDDTNDTFRFLLPGVYQLILTGTFEHNSSNQGRTTNVRFYNVDDATSAPAEIIGTGRNAEASPFTVAFLVNADETIWNKNYRVEFGGGDSYSSVVFNALDLQIVGIEPTVYFPLPPPTMTEFNGTSSRVLLSAGDSAAGNLSGNVLNVSAVVNASAGTIVAKGGSSGGYFIHVNGSGFVEAVLKQSGSSANHWIAASADTDIRALSNPLIEVALDYTGGTPSLEVKVNGVSESITQNTPAGSYGDSGQQVSWGARNNGTTSPWLSGGLHNVSIANGTATYTAAAETADTDPTTGWPNAVLTDCTTSPRP